MEEEFVAVVEDGEAKVTKMAVVEVAIDIRIPLMIGATTGTMEVDAVEDAGANVLVEVVESTTIISLGTSDSA